MILNFTQKVTTGPLRGWVTEFVDKITNTGTKIHTIRPDLTNRWKKGNKIHFATGGYKPGRVFHEADCVGVIPFSIEWEDYNQTQKRAIVKTGRLVSYFIIPADQYALMKKGKDFNYVFASRELKELAANDGFPDVGSFFCWFNENFKGKLICWKCPSYAVYWPEF